ncbi:MAG: Wzz/FepE/Etk N-terminal domain-containing protein [bacterium]|nr:Wzz/FepE/Etk N-terminal domain-containing protein [bacterium]
MPFQNNDELEIDLYKYIQIIGKRKRTVILVSIATIIITLIINLRAPKLYEAGVVFMVATKPSIKADLTGRIETAPLPDLSVSTYLELLKNPFLGDQVVEELRKEDPSFDDLSAEDLINLVKLHEIPNTSLIELIIRYPSRDKAIKIANTMADYFIKETGKLNDTQQTQQLFVDKLKTWKSNLENSEEKLKDFNTSSNLGVWEGKVHSLTSQIVDAEDGIRFLIGTISEETDFLKQVNVQMQEQQPKLVTNKSITDDQFLQQLSKDITREQAVKLNSLKVSNEELNPIYMDLMRRKVDVTLRLNNNKTKLIDLQNSLKDLNKELTIANKEFTKKKMAQTILTREVNLAQDTYKLVSQKNDELSIIGTKDSGLVKIVRPGYASPYPVSPRVRRNTFVGGLVGILLGILIAIGYEYITNSRE